ncbi:MAG: S41 family peptidase [Acidobacteriota bacterium]|nr:MAG: S41 family peptidase [Acidobacteriota bacterium]
MLKKLIVGISIMLLLSAAVITSQAISEERAGEDRVYRGYVQAMEMVREKYVEELGYERLTSTSIQGMLRTLDPHSNYYTRKAFEEMRMEQRSHYYGIGSTIQQRYNGVYIIEPFENTPAARAGLRYGDQIIRINGEVAEGWNSDRIRDNLRGELGTEVEVTVRRAGAAEPVTVKIERAAVDLPSISATYMAGDGVGYVALSRGFHSTTSEELISAIMELRSQGMTSLVLDLRGNPGGFLDQAIRVADKFLHRGQTILSVRGREGSGNFKEWTAESGMPESFPVVVMIDGGSASASEIVAGAIQDHDRGLIVGLSSFGKGLVQTIFPLNGGAGLTLTTARYYTPSGRLIQRDYSNGSTYEYLYRRSGAAQPPDKPSKEERRTDTGRIVYGGGGIEPDVRVEPLRINNTQAAIWTTGLFMFVRDLMAGKVTSAPGFKRAGIDFEHQPKPDEFTVTDAIMKSYRDYMKGFLAKNDDLGLTMAQVDEHFEWARRKIREEALISAYGVDTQRMVMRHNDVQLQRAIAEIPKSAQLAERARSLNKTTKK